MGVSIEKSAPSNKPLLYWLFGTCFLIWLMIMLGGATRLTHAGLSIVDWKPLTGIIPPLTSQDWSSEFANYKQYPEYQQVNRGMDLKAFQFIYYMEYAHRLLGRLIGLWFALPLLFFWKCGRLSRVLKKRALIILFLGFCQGFAGWYMVKSGLSKNASVSHYRLTAHLGLAIALYIMTLLMAFEVSEIRSFNLAQSKVYSLKRLVFLCCALLCLNILYGGLVAGLKAGLIYNTFPLMEGNFLPYEWKFYRPLWINFFENAALVQWIHRWLGISALCIITLTCGRAFNASSDSRLRAAALLFMGIIFLQVILGILTLLNQVPLSLGVLHQGNAVIALSAGLYLFYGIKNAELALARLPN